MRGASITGYAAVAKELGLDPRAMLRAFDIDPRALVEPELRIPGERVIALLDGSAEATGCETFGLRMVEHRELADYGPISLLFAHQPTLRDMFETMIRYQRMLNSALSLHLEDAPGDTVVVRQEILSDGPPGRQAYELAIGTLYKVFRGPRAPPWRARTIHLSHSAPADLSVHRRVFGAPIEFEAAFNGFTCSRRDMDTVNPLADPSLARYAEEFVRRLPHAGEVTVATEVERAIHVLLPFNGASVAAVAERLGVNPRTLQRRLDQEGVEFSTLLNEIRREHALRYLPNRRVSLAEVAGLVGYGQETSFARWFAAEFGLSPRAWRAARA
jgi:AraC-like DNA-binding protein